MRALLHLPTFSILLLSLYLPVAAGIAKAGDLYSATTFVTGQREETRWPGIEQTFRQVLVKVTGTSRILEAASLADELPHARDHVTMIHYRDRMEGIPHHDEQGSRDRPFDLTVHFEREWIDAIVEELGYHKWEPPRPTIVTLVKVDFQGAGFIVATDAKEGIGQREALLAEADRLGLTIALPDVATLQDLTIPTAGNVLAAGDMPAGLAHDMGGDILLAGTLIWDNKNYQWNSHWETMIFGHSSLWDETTITFDSAFREGLGRTSEILARGK